jgi:hypothetical protein
MVDDQLSLALSTNIHTLPVEVVTGKGVRWLFSTEIKDLWWILLEFEFQKNTGKELFQRFAAACTETTTSAHRGPKLVRTLCAGSNVGKSVLAVTRHSGPRSEVKTLRVVEGHTTNKNIL